jgi:hypothetical protein
MKKGDLALAKQTIMVREAWVKLALPGDVPERDGVTFRCPFPTSHAHGDQTPSFNIYHNGSRFKCFGCGKQGGVVDLIAWAMEISECEACKVLIKWAGNRGEGVIPVKRVARRTVPKGGWSSEPAHTVTEKPRVTPPRWRLGNLNEKRLLAETRSISLDAVELASRSGVLRFANVCNFPSWVLHDGSFRAIEARRIDRLQFPKLRRLPKRKAHSIKNTDKSWPVGVDVLGRQGLSVSRMAGKPAQLLERPPPSFRAIMLVEGGPDFLAALHFIHAADVGDVWPVAMLGRTVGRAIHPEALALLSGLKVRIYPHADIDGDGVEAAKKWGRQLAAVGCAVDGFSFTGLRQRDGSQVKDLNDCCLIHPDDAVKLLELLP